VLGLTTQFNVVLFFSCLEILFNHCTFQVGVCILQHVSTYVFFFFFGNSYYDCYICFVFRSFALDVGISFVHCIVFLSGCVFVSITVYKNI
jgi:hypothetical protein